MSTELSRAEATLLAKCEATIERGLKKFIEVGTALLAIRDQKLYRATHDTFEAYCAERWGMSRAHAYRMIDAAGVASNLSPIGDISPQESQIRPLVGLVPDEQRQAWTRANQTAPNGRLTAKHVGRTVRELFAEREILKAAKDIRAIHLERQRSERNERRLADLAARAAAGSPSKTCRIVEGDCVDVLHQLRAAGERARLVFSDPPYKGSEPHPCENLR